MPRLVKKTAHAPVQVGDKFICMCGLSQNLPFCDKHHLETIGEDDTKLYWYENGKRELVSEEESECEDGCCGSCCEEESSDKECCGHGDCCKNEDKKSTKK